MKLKRFLSVFLVVLLMASTALPMAAAVETPDPPKVEDPQIRAKGALLVDLNTGLPVYAKGEHQELYPASLTKIMTALLVLEAVDSGKLTLDQMVTASASALEGLAADGSSAGIKVGETMSVENLLYCMLIVSANEACDILAEAVSGSVDAFVTAMNAKAKALGCENTHFVNPNGLHDSRHYTSAWDLYLITKAAMEYEEFMKICDTADVVLPATNLAPERHLYTTNYLLSSWRVVGYRNKAAHGIKTGSTDEAGHCLVSTATKGSLHFLSVILGAERVETNGVGDVQSFSETTRLFQWGFDNFSYQSVLRADEVIKEVAVSLSRKVNYVTVHPAQDVEALLPKGLAAADLERVVTLKQDPVEAPIAQDQVLGTVTLRHDGKEFATVDLLALNSVEASKLLTFWRNVQLFFQKTVVRVICVILGLLLLALAGWKITMGRRRYRYGRTVSTNNSKYRGRRKH
ncbi:MAG: D-alanyl-D-alanine carboxypeptidase family protein [Oscillibacter sp.]